MFSTHISRLHKIFQYASPKGRYHAPRLIQPNMEEMEVIVAGQGYFIDGGHPIDIGPGGIVWYYPGDIVEVTSHEREPYNTIVFEFIATGEPEYRRPMASYWTNAIECANFCRQMLEQFVTRSYPSEHFAWYVYSRLFWESLHSTASSEHSLPSGLIKALRIIEERYLREIDIKWLAAKAGISVPYLHQLFHREMGCPPLQFILQKRLERAKLLLRSTELPIKQIAQESGFRDVSGFCRTFRLKTGTTPAKYRDTTP